NADKAILELINKEGKSETPKGGSGGGGVGGNDKAQSEATKRLKAEIEEQKKWIQFSEESYKDLEHIRQEDVDFLKSITDQKIAILKR
ncbi:hypothetical protein ABK046_47695, partial [Streptomyces caeruleatus]